MTDDVGGDSSTRASTSPIAATGYCTDDIARALIVAVAATPPGRNRTRRQALVTTYLSYLHDAQLPDGWFHNFMGYDRALAGPARDRRLLRPRSVGPRLLHALRAARLVAPGRTQLLDRALPHVDDLEHLRSRAYAALGIAMRSTRPMQTARRCVPPCAAAVEPIAAAFGRQAGADWDWCEPKMTYDNARLPEALMRAGQVLGEPRLAESACRC